MTNKYIRYVVTHEANGGRVMSFACQFRNTFETQERAQAYVQAVMQNNSPGTLRSIFVDPNSVQVRSVECWEMKDGSIGDPKTIWFD